MRDRTLVALAERLSEYDPIVEIGIGRRSGLARELDSRGVDVTATDIVDRETPRGVRFVVNDVTDPTVAVYADAEAVVARNLPPELHRPAARLADRVGAEFLFTTLGGDQPTVPVYRETLPEETLYRHRSIPQRP